MALVEYNERGNEVAELAPLCAVGGSPSDANPHAIASPAAKRPGMHPARWLAAAFVIVLLCWDAWQSLQEVKVRSRTHGAPISQVDR